MRRLLALLALAAVPALAADLNRFKLGEAIPEAQIFACREQAPAVSLMRAVARGEKAEAEARGYLASGVCGMGAAIITYKRRVLLVREGGHEYTVYEGVIGEGTTVYVLMIDWTHEDKA